MSSQSGTSPRDDIYQTTADDIRDAKERSRPGEGPHEQIYEKVRDPGSGRMVSMKPANKPFLKAKERRESYRQRKSKKSNPWTTLLFVLIFLPLLSSFTTNTYTFTLGPRYLPKIKKWVATNDFNPFKTELRTFSPDQLRKFDGRDRWLPVYIAILGQVYDVTKNRRIYGQGGSYNMMAGRDASRSFVTGCFQTHLTHDLRGLSDEQLQGIETWRKFFENHPDYRLVGTVSNPPIDPSSPIPPDCHVEDDGNKETASPQDIVRPHASRPKSGDRNVHEEL